MNKQYLCHSCLVSIDRNRLFLHDPLHQAIYFQALHHGNKYLTDGESIFLDKLQQSNTWLIPQSFSLLFLIIEKVLLHYKILRQILKSCDAQKNIQVWPEMDDLSQLICLFRSTRYLQSNFLK